MCAVVSSSLSSSSVVFRGRLQQVLPTDGKMLIVYQTKAKGKGFVLELFQMDVQDCRLEVLAIQLCWKVSHYYFKRKIGMYYNIYYNVLYNIYNYMMIIIS